RTGAHVRAGQQRPGPGPVRRVGDPLRDRAVRIGRPEPLAQQRRGLGLLPDHPRHLEALRRQRPRGVPRAEVRAGRGGVAHLEPRRRGVELGVRRHRRDPLTRIRARRPIAVKLLVVALLLAAFLIRLAYVENTYFPPAFPYFLGLVDLIDGHQAGGKTALGPERVATSVLGTLSVGLLGL